MTYDEAVAALTAALATLRRYGARLVERGAHPLGAPLAGVALVSEALALLGFASDESPVFVPQGVIEVKDLEEEALAPFVATGSFIDAEAVSGGAFTGAWDVASWRPIHGGGSFVTAGYTASGAETFKRRQGPRSRRPQRPLVETDWRRVTPPPPRVPVRRDARRTGAHGSQHAVAVAAC